MGYYRVLDSNPRELKQYLECNVMNKKTTKNKRKMKKLPVILLAIVVLCMSLRLTSVYADFGNFAGDNDYGYDSGFDSDDSWDSSGSWDSGSSDSSGGGSGFLITVIVIIIIVVLVIRMSKKENKGDVGRNVSVETPLRPLSELKGLDQGFDEAEFKEHLSNLYIQMQQRWHERDITSLKPYFTDAFYNQSEMQLKEMKRNKQTPCTERVAVLEVKPNGFYQSSGMDHIVVTVRSRIVAYVVNDETGNLISGDRNREKFMTYEWDLCRSSGVVTGRTDGMQAVNCPHCGATVNINQSARCEYCGGIIEVQNQDWALDSIKGLAQKGK